MARMTGEPFPRVYGKNLGDVIHLQLTNEGLELTLDNDDQEVTIVLESYGARQLRLLLQRYERELKNRSATADAGQLDAPRQLD